jgi:ABC-type multidrug transport system fused ATPase/permease subunit
LQENIVFGSPFDEARYKAVIDQCGLERDISLFEAGDATEVGEKGLTLSGGQKARITLARAIYSRAEIILLDDVLAALEYAELCTLFATILTIDPPVYTQPNGSSTNASREIW